MIIDAMLTSVMMLTQMVANVTQIALFGTVLVLLLKKQDESPSEFVKRTLKR